MLSYLCQNDVDDRVNRALKQRKVFAFHIMDFDSAASVSSPPPLPVVVVAAANSTSFAGGPHDRRHHAMVALILLLNKTLLSDLTNNSPHCFLSFAVIDVAVDEGESRCTAASVSHAYN